MTHFGTARRLTEAPVLGQPLGAHPRAELQQSAGEAVFSKARVITSLGNRAVHSHRAIPADDAVVAVRELFHVTYWLARTYARGTRPAPGLDRGAAKEALGSFLDGKRMSASQIEFADMIVNHLTEHGVMEAAILY